MAKQQLPHVPDCLCAEFIEKTGEPCPSKSRSLKNRLIIALCVMVFCLCLMLFPRNADGGKAAEEPSVSADFPSDDPAVTLGRPGWYYGGVQPCLRYNGKLYYWEGISKENVWMDAHYVTIADTSSFLPEGCVEIGEIHGCTADAPTEELQLQADFETYGPVYGNPDTPEVLYAYLANTWGNAGDFYYVRFVTDTLCNSELIFWQGNHYRIAVGRTDVTPWLKKLPEGAQVIGNLSFVGEDPMPQRDLETNQQSDAYSYALNGREVLAVPGDNSVIYVYCHRYWAKGDYPAWLACPLWALP